MILNLSLRIMSMRRRSLHALYPFILLFCSLVCLRAPDARPQTGARAQSAGAANTREDRLRVFDQVWRAISDNYYDKRYRGVDWRLQREVFRPQAEAARNSAELYRVLRQMIGQLGDAHTRVYAPDEGFDRDRPAGATVGAGVRRVEGKPVVAWGYPDSQGARKGIRTGFTLLQVGR